MKFCMTLKVIYIFFTERLLFIEKCILFLLIKAKIEAKIIITADDAEMMCWSNR